MADGEQQQQQSPEQGLGRQLIELQRENSRLQQELQQTQGQLQELGGERTKLQSQLTDTQSQLSNQATQNQALQGLYSAGVLPEYQDLMAREAATAIRNAGDKPVGEVMDSLRSQYPAMFRAEGVPTGAGATPSATPPQQPQTPTVSLDNQGAFLSNLEGIADGSIQVQ